MGKRTKLAIGLATLAITTAVVTRLPSPRLFRAEKDRIEVVSGTATQNPLKNAAAQVPKFQKRTTVPKQQAEVKQAEESVGKEPNDSASSGKMGKQWKRALYIALGVLAAVASKLLYGFRKKENGSS